MKFYLPFFSALDEKKRRMGITEIVKHELVDSYPVLWEKDGTSSLPLPFLSPCDLDRLRRIKFLTSCDITVSFSFD